MSVGTALYHSLNGSFVIPPTVHQTDITAF